MQFRKVILNLFDGDAGADDGAGSGGESTKSAISPETAARAKSLGLSDDMLQDYQAAFGSGNKDNKGNEKGPTEKQEADDPDNEFKELIKGKYKEAYSREMSAAIKERVQNLTRERKELQGQLDNSNRILDMLRGKYPDLDPDDPEALYNAVRSDGDIWRDRAVETGGSIEEAVNAFDEGQRQESEREELERYRRQERARALDAHLQELAVETQKKYPSFDLHAEFENPKFRQALDFIAQSNSERNKSSGRDDEIYDLTYAYELAHAEELQKNVVARASKATASAYAQTVAANRGRIQENAAQGSAKTQPVSIDSMSDEEFDKLVRDVKSGRARIPG